MTKQEPPETCAWCARRTNQGHRPNCPRPGEVFTATDLRNARAEATAAAEQRLRDAENALRTIADSGQGTPGAECLWCLDDLGAHRDGCPVNIARSALVGDNTNAGPEAGLNHLREGEGPKPDSGASARTVAKGMSANQPRPAPPPASPRQGEPVGLDAKRLRHVLWGACPHTGKYGDDGEMQCRDADFRRADFDGLMNHVSDALFERGLAAPASPRQEEPVDVERLAADGALYRVWDRVAALRLTGDWATRKRQVLDILAEERRNLVPEAK